MKHLFSVFLLVAAVSVFGQTATDSTASNEPWSFQSADKIIKFSPLDAFSFMPTFGADVEVKMKKSSSLQAGAAIIPSFFQFLSNEVFNDYDRMGGYKLRGEARVYMPVKTNQYLGLGVQFRHIIIRDEVPIGMEGTEGEFGEQQFAYFINTPMVFHRLNTFIDLKWGFQRETTSNIVFDFYGGLSIRYIGVRSSSDIPEGGSVPEQRGVWRLEDGYRLTYPTPILGLKIGFKK